MNSPLQPSSPPPRTSPLPGDYIRIVSGELAGLTGCITCLTAEGRCALCIDDLADGVTIAVSANILERLG
jgi:hypothetical protein